MSGLLRGCGPHCGITGGRPECCRCPECHLRGDVRAFLSSARARRIEPTLPDSPGALLARLDELEADHGPTD